MTHRERKLIIAMILVLAAWLALITVISEARLENYDNRIHELECRHVMYEDFSTAHQDGEQARLCVAP